MIVSSFRTLVVEALPEPLCVDLVFPVHSSQPQQGEQALSGLLGSLMIFLSHILPHCQRMYQQLTSVIMMNAHLSVLRMKLTL